MPLGKFTEEARYLGSGDVNFAANWTCNANDTRMLRVGGDGTRQAQILQRRCSISMSRSASTASKPLRRGAPGKLRARLAA